MATGCDYIIHRGLAGIILMALLFFSGYLIWDASNAIGASALAWGIGGLISGAIAMYFLIQAYFEEDILSGGLFVVFIVATGAVVWASGGASVNVAALGLIGSACTLITLDQTKDIFSQTS